MSQDPIPQVRRSITLNDLIDDLVWPVLLRAPALALRPMNLVASFAGCVVVAAVDGVLGPERGEMMATLGAVAEQPDPGSAASALIGLPLRVWPDVIADHPASVVTGVIAIAVWIVVAGFIGRRSALELAGRPCDTREALGFVRRRAASLALVSVVPLAVLVVFAVLFAVVGGLRDSYVGLAVEVLTPVLFVVGLVVAAVTLLLGLVFVMLTPAVACEDADSIEVSAAAFAYVLGRPLRFVVYGLVLFTICAVVMAVINAIVGWAWVLAADGYAATSMDYQEFWRRVFWLVPTGFALSYTAAAGTVLYLALRRIHDGQDITEVWDAEAAARGLEGRVHDSTIDPRGS